jgi:hypothetical protein
LLGAEVEQKIEQIELASAAARQKIRWVVPFLLLLLLQLIPSSSGPIS